MELSMEYLASMYGIRIGIGSNMSRNTLFVIIAQELVMQTITILFRFKVIVS
jgi:hypothetical protein